MAKRKAARRAKSARPARKAPVARRSVKRPTSKRAVKRKASAKKKPGAKKASKKPVRKAVTAPKAKAAPKVKGAAAPPAKMPRLDRARRTLSDAEPHSTPSSLDMDRHGSAVRTGRAEAAQNVREHHGMDDVTGGDPDVDIEDAYFAGEEAPGGDNPTPDQDIVEDIGKALGVTYNDNEELEGADKLEKRDKHRWELDPASSDDYKDRD
jgi:hypothetical protein